MNNLDEDIKIVFNEIKRTNLACGFNEQTKILKSRDNILKRLLELEEDLTDHEKTSFEFQELYIKTKSELETYKKIAEKLAEKKVVGCINCTVSCVSDEDIDTYIKNEIDWARNEVENDKQS